MVEEKDVLEDIKETIERGRRNLGRVDKALKFLEAMNIDVSTTRKDYEDTRKRIDKMDTAYKAVTTE